MSKAAGICKKAAGISFGNSHKHTTGLVEGSQFTGIGHVVQVGSPVGRVVLLDLARGTVRGPQLVVGDVAAERCMYVSKMLQENVIEECLFVCLLTTTTVDGVNVLTDNTRGIDGIDTLEDEPLPAGQAPEGVRLQSEEGKGKKSLAQHA
jgi:hypothetical protein